ncbi:hypothetical protein Tco_1539955 [Tanacetum coccineum]
MIHEALVKCQLSIGPDPPTLELVKGDRNGDDEHPNLECCLLKSTSGFQEKAGKLSSPDVMEKKENSSLEARTP